jgi:hypothetical protein
MNKYLITTLTLTAAALILLVGATSSAASCEYDRKMVTEPVEYSVNKGLPSHLKGATITITLSDGKSSTVSAEKFMVVPRVQRTIVGENKLIIVKKTCQDDLNKNTLMIEGRHDIKNVVTEKQGLSAHTYAEKELIPGIDYYRRQILDTPIGAGIGIDTNATPKVFLGIDF